MQNADIFGKFFNASPPICSSKFAAVKTLCAIIRWRLNLKISTFTEITEQQWQYLGSGMNFCIYPVNQGYAKEIIEEITDDISKTDNK